MSGAREGVQYCQAPIHAVLANSDTFDGRQMATFGYLLHENGRRDILGPLPDALQRIDFLGCIDVDLAGVRYEDSITDLEPGIYFVMVQGRYTDGAVNGACVGSFSEPYISRISRVEGDDERDARCAVIAERSQNGDVIRVCEEIFQRLWSQGEQAERYLQITGYVAYLDHTPHLFASKDTYLYSGGRGGIRLELPPSERGRFDRVASGGGAVTVAGRYMPGRKGGNVIGSLEVIGRHYWEQGLPGEMPRLPEG